MTTSVSLYMNAGCVAFTSPRSSLLLVSFVSSSFVGSLLSLSYCPSSSSFSSFCCCCDDNGSWQSFRRGLYYRTWLRNSGGKIRVLSLNTNFYSKLIRQKLFSRRKMKTSHQQNEQEEEEEEERWRGRGYGMNDDPQDLLTGSDPGQPSFFFFFFLCLLLSRLSSPLFVFFLFSLSLHASFLFLFSWGGFVSFSGGAFNAREIVDSTLSSSFAS